MRTTIEIRPEHRTRLIALAAERGEKGFSKIIEEALEAYLDDRIVRADRRRAVSKLRGSLGDREAKALRTAVAEIRKSWR